jgi:flagellar hook assembly protein FlgD
LALLAKDGDLWVGGEFSLAGPTGSSRIARWSSPAMTAAPLTLGALGMTMQPARPNPSTGVTNVAFSLASAGDVTVDVVDVRGARVRSLTRIGLEVGTHTITWDGRDAAGRRVPAGVYFLALRDGRSSVGQRVVIVR